MVFVRDTRMSNYQDIEIGIAIGILRQRNLIPLGGRTVLS